MPVLDLSRNIDAIAQFHFDRRLAFFLIITAPGNANNNLTATVFGMMNVPIVAASWFKCDVVDVDLTRRNRSKIAFADKILCKTIVWGYARIMV